MGEYLADGTYMNEKRYEIIELTNNETWADIVEWLGHMNEAEIRAEIVRLWGNDEHTAALSADIWDEFNRVC